MINDHDSHNYKSLILSLIITMKVTIIKVMAKLTKPYLTITDMSNEYFPGVVASTIYYIH